MPWHISSGGAAAQSKHEARLRPMRGLLSLSSRECGRVFPSQLWPHFVKETSLRAESLSRAPAAWLRIRTFFLQAQSSRARCTWAQEPRPLHQRALRSRRKAACPEAERRRMQHEQRHLHRTCAQHGQAEPAFQEAAPFCAGPLFPFPETSWGRLCGAQERCRSEGHMRAHRSSLSRSSRLRITT